ncbi:hypothetical protein AVEN_14694-1 [Araneus ventricosus]|uniref:Uncharacterized protein n=1 Tax=Araneus ventricosus TaxID=182803 RepID=A0A4Y2NHF6_ARAVE|nr:hypothetical protein AVEN_14694-1 [Araneus ventricosus]
MIRSQKQYPSQHLILQIKCHINYENVETTKVLGAPAMHIYTCEPNTSRTAHEQLVCRYRQGYGLATNGLQAAGSQVWMGFLAHCKPNPAAFSANTKGFTGQSGTHLNAVRCSLRTSFKPARSNLQTKVYFVSCLLIFFHHFSSNYGVIRRKFT